MSQNNDPIRRSSRKLSWLLRHGACESGLTMDAAGWAPISEVLRLTRMSAATLEAVVRENNKQRLQVEDGVIRASQGHSLDGTPVTLEALEASWSVWTRSQPLWHGTRAEVVEGIAKLGILAQGRTHVHLAESLDSTVGKRANVAVMLQLDPQKLRDAGQPVFVSSNGVVLVRHVPPSCIVGLKTLTRRAQKQHDVLHATLRLGERQSSKAPARSSAAPIV
jgi:putative RNA 2'-phosphotransferase